MSGVRTLLVVRTIVILEPFGHGAASVMIETALGQDCSIRTLLSENGALYVWNVQDVEVCITLDQARGPFLVHGSNVRAM